jgi:hypothetical protein
MIRMPRLPSAFRPLAPSAAVSKGIVRYCAAITSEAAPGTDIASRALLERMLMRILNTAGLRAVERMIAGAQIPGLAAVTDRVIPGRREWTAIDRERGGRLGIVVSSNQYYRFKSVSVTWSALPRELKPHEQKVHQIQQAFYARYNAAAERDNATPPRRISAADRRILLVGEFEADWNNGGFNQYLDNKGRRRATAALRALEQISAHKTAALLRQALAAANDEAALQKLDDKYDRTGEDLAVLAMKADA